VAAAGQHGGRRRPGGDRAAGDRHRRGLRDHLGARWRKQDGAVQAIEERDGVTFYVERTSPVRPIQLVRTPGFRREVPSLNGSR
jgi:hypothetical protein